MKFLAVFCLFVTPGFCQLFSFGVKAGVPLGNVYPNVGTDINEARHYLVGATAELHLPLRFSVELDALYKRTGVNGPSTVAPSFELNSTEKVRANQWEFPLLAKYELTGGLLRPFVDAGPVLRHLSGIDDLLSYTLQGFAPTVTTVSRNTSSLLVTRNSAGFSVGGGIALKVLHFRVSPEIRYTRWTSSSFYGSTGNQADVIVGFTF